MFTCQLPDQLQFCDLNTGCSPGVQCLADLNGDGLCVKVCDGGNQSADCGSLTTFCQPVFPYYNEVPGYICFPNGCGPKSNPPNGKEFYGPCDAAGSGDGFCVPHRDPFYAVHGLCLQVGSAPVGSACQPSRTGPDPAQLCVAGTFCVAGLTGKTICDPICALDGSDAGTLVDGGPGCPAGTLCVAAPGQAETWGVCVALPSPDGGCPPPLDCFALPNDSGENVCLP